MNYITITNNPTYYADNTNPNPGVHFQFNAYDLYQAIMFQASLDNYFSMMANGGGYGSFGPAYLTQGHGIDSYDQLHDITAAYMVNQATEALSSDNEDKNDSFQYYSPFFINPFFATDFLFNAPPGNGQGTTFDAERVNDRVDLFNARIDELANRNSVADFVAGGRSIV